MEKLPLYPDVVVKLVGENGNAINLLAKVTTAMKKQGVNEQQRNAFIAEATSSDYDYLLRTCIKWVTVI